MDLLSVIQQAYVEGVSTKRVDHLVKAQGCDGIRKPVLSLPKGAKCPPSVGTWTRWSKSSRADSWVPVPIHMFGWTYWPGRSGKAPARLWWMKVGALVATGVNGTGRREFPCSLNARGLSGLQPVISDARQGLKQAISWVFSEARWQRHETSFIADQLKGYPSALTRASLPRVASSTSSSLPGEPMLWLTGWWHYSGSVSTGMPKCWGTPRRTSRPLPPSQHPIEKSWSNNPPERLNKAIHWRTDVVGIVPNRAAVRRLVGAVLGEQQDEWAEARRYPIFAHDPYPDAQPTANILEVAPRTPSPGITTIVRIDGTLPWSALRLSRRLARSGSAGCPLAVR